jgi:predicted ATPase
MITRLEIEAFKSFGSPGEKLGLGTLNFLVGANAAGKTNIVSAFRFLRKSILGNVDDAVGEFGGTDEIRCRVGELASRQTKLLVTAEQLGIKFTGADGRNQVATKLAYFVEVEWYSEPQSGRVRHEWLDVELQSDAGATSWFKLERFDNEVRVSDPTSPAQHQMVLNVPVSERGRLAAGNGLLGQVVGLFREWVKGWSLFSIDPEIVRQPVYEGTEIVLGEHGENLATVLREIQKQNDSGALRTIVDGIGGAVNGFNGVEAVQLASSGAWGFKALEHQIGDLRPQSISDGTVRLLALLIIATWSAQNATLVIIEEPEIGLHPHLSKAITDLLREASQKCQFIVTTHNPRFLDYLQPNEVLLCDKIDGFTKVRPASDREQIAIFQKRFTLGELWQQGVLGGIP